MAREPDFIATVNYNGVRKKPASSGYRPLIRFEGREGLTSGQQIFIGVDCVYPGETADAEIIILSPQMFTNYLYEGMPFDFMESPRHPIGTGTITRIINNELKRK